ncbi:MAG: Alpha,4-N-acetylgalactosamine transferase PglH [Herminiimonas sp.]|nr:Alpha,4-N-acetylgalactosamine transferase PglH [Herminiimonas sp.]
MNKIRVLFHLTHLRRGGGIESSLMSWLRILDRNLFSVGLSIAYPTDDIATVFRARIPDDVPIHILGPEPWLSYCRNLKKAGRLGWPGLIYEELLLPQVRKRVFRNRINSIAAEYDLVIDYDLSLARFASGFGKPLIGVSHFSLTQKLSLQSKGRRYRATAKHYRRYDAMVAICDAMRQEARAFFPSFAQRFTTLYPGFDLNEARRRADEPADGIPEHPYIVSVTRLEETQKDVTTLIKAFALLVRQHAIAESLLIVGEGRDRAALENLSEQLGVRDRVRFAGFTANPLPFMKHARMMVLSSRLEGLPTVLIEGLLLGQVLVSSDCPTGPKEILDNGAAGLLVPMGDPAALAAAMLRGLTDDALRAGLHRAALGHAESFSVDAFRSRFMQLVRQVREAGPPA